MAKSKPKKNSAEMTKAVGNPKSTNKMIKGKKPAPQPTAKTAPKGKKTKNNTKQKPKLYQRIGKSFKEVISELKKVTWPKWKTVLSSTTVVIVVVLFFLIILTAMDFGLIKLLELLTGSAA